MKKVLLVGGSGLIGSHLAHVLGTSGFDVTSIDKREPLKTWPDSEPSITRINENVLTDLEALKIIDFAKPDTVVFLAATVHDAQASFASPALTMEPIGALINVFHAAQRAGATKFLYVSGTKNTAETNPSPLSTLHNLSEEFLRDSQSDSMEVICLKPTNVYAPGTSTKRNSLLNSMLTSAKEGVELAVNLQARGDYVYVNDVALAITGAIIRERISIFTVHQKRGLKMYYLSSGQPTISVQQLISSFQKVADELGYPRLKHKDNDRCTSLTNMTDMKYEESDMTTLMAIAGKDATEPLSINTGLSKLIGYEIVSAYKL
jgi:nucleoside-diphosphate-sugar epimerase